jgi:hypothetical protein
MCILEDCEDRIDLEVYIQTRPHTRPARNQEIIQKFHKFFALNSKSFSSFDLWYTAGKTEVLLFECIMNTASKPGSCPGVGLLVY